MFDMCICMVRSLSGVLLSTVHLHTKRQKSRWLSHCHKVNNSSKRARCCCTADAGLRCTAAVWLRGCS